jgi:hypothetical protein
LNFVNTTELVPVIDSVRSYRDFASAISDMKEGKQFGKLVLQFDHSLAKL